MSVQLLPASGPGGNNGNLQGTTVGGSKPLHRFMKGEPKIVGIIVLVLGASFITSFTGISGDNHMHIWTSMVSGAMFIISGILYLLTAHNPTKKTVTTSLAMSIVSILVVCWNILHFLPIIIMYSHIYSYDFSDDTTTEASEVNWRKYYEDMGQTLLSIFVFYNFAGGIILIVMSAFAGAALRSTKTQTIVVMTATSTETPAE